MTHDGRWFIPIKKSFGVAHIPRLVDKEQLPGCGVETHDTAGGNESVQPEVLGQHPDDPAVDKEQMATVFELGDKAPHPIAERHVGFAPGDLEIAKDTKDLAVR